jgi:hypothetical protein
MDNPKPRIIWNAYGWTHLSVLAQTAFSFASSVETTWCASVRGKKVTLRMGRKGGLHEKTYGVCGSTQYDKRMLGGNRS